MSNRNLNKTFVRRSMSGRVMRLFVVALLLNVMSNSASAATLDITLNERVFANTNTIDDDAVCSGTLDVPSFTATPNGSFALNTYSLKLADRNGVPLLFETGLPLNGVDGVPRIENDNAGQPWYLSNASPTIPSLPNSFSFFIQAQLNGIPNTGHLLTLNTIGGAGVGPTEMRERGYYRP